MIKDGLYEQIINSILQKEIDESDKVIEKKPIDLAEAPKILAKYVAEIVEKRLDDLAHGDNVSDQIALVNSIIDVIQKEAEGEDRDALSIVDQPNQLLLAAYNRKNTIWAIDHKAAMIRPETSIAQSSLFTGATQEPQLLSEMKKEISSCSRIDFLVSFIKWSGLRQIMKELELFTSNGGKLRVVTTSYMGATDLKAVEELKKLSNTEIKVSYDTKRTRLHAKAYIFYRDNGFTTAYVGSSNLSNVAISSGLEWNVKIARKELPETVEKIAATFDSYWNSSEFEAYDETQRDRLTRALCAERRISDDKAGMYVMDINPYPYQQEILENLEVERKIRGNMRNLIVAATGTGKTVISALDYRNYKKSNPGKPCRLLFVAHREEILEQSLYTFRAVLQDANFGEMFVGKYRPSSLDNLFVSIQTFNSKNLTEKTTNDFFDFIIVDEFHHAAAPTYQKLLEYYRPKILLGLTATPERMDGKSVLCYFNNRIAAEIRLPEAIGRKLLCPFQYFGVTDTVDLDKLKWTAGGYDKGELSNIYTFSGHIAERRAGLIVSSLMKYITDIDQVKGLGFCVSVEHAQFMAKYFVEHNIPARCLSGQTPDEERKNAKEELVSGAIRFIFVVDIYNEGVDIPEVNTILFLRPTESLTVFVQQLGRGLRNAEGKECLTVLDFIGRANRRYNFEGKFAALLKRSSRSIQQEVKDGFLSAPAGCYIQLEKKAQETILDNIRKSIEYKPGLLARIQSFEADTGNELTFNNFLEYYHLDPRLIYGKKTTFYELFKAAKGLSDSDANMDLPVVSYNVLYRLSTMDSAVWLRYIIENLDSVETIEWESLARVQQLMWQMLYVSIWEKPNETMGFHNALEGIRKFKTYNQLFNETKALLQYCFNHIGVVGRKAELSFPCPLEVHCTYTRAQILAALDFVKDYSVSEGVKYIGELDSDVLFTTLNKSDRYYSPTTAYNDFSINQWLFHWQSQSTTKEDSKTGERYQNRDRSGYTLLFVRERKSDSFGPQPFVFLGPVYYHQHEGSKPMNVVWRLKYPIPSKYIKVTNKLIAE